MHFIVFGDCTLNFTVTRGLRLNTRSFRQLSCIAIFSNNAFDGQGATMSLTLEPIRPLFQLL